jgi:hypothetical protein
MTDDEEFIAGFLEVFEKNPQIFVEQPGAVDALNNLSNTISDMTDKSNEEVADAIGEWCEEYPDITNEINEINSIILYKSWNRNPSRKKGKNLCYQIAIQVCPKTSEIGLLSLSRHASKRVLPQSGSPAGVETLPQS